MSHDHSPGDPAHYTGEFWDERYRSADKLWSGQPNVQLVAQACDLAPGEALDAGCGEGADAIWLALRGWSVLGVDVSAVALERAAGHASAQGHQIAGRISWQREDLRSWDPAPRQFDLASAQFMHMPPPLLETVHARLASAVRPRGTLLVVSHHRDDLHVKVGRPSGPLHMFPSPEELAASLDPAAWEIIVAAPIGRPATDLDGKPVTLTDTVLRAVRRS